MAQHLHAEPVHRNLWRSRVAGCLIAVVLAACGGGDPATTSPPEAMQPTTVTGADGTSMDFTPAEGLAAAALSITRVEAGAPVLPPGMQAAGSVYQFAPLGHVGSAIEIRVPFNATQPASSAPRLLVTLPGEGSWSEVDAQLEGTMLRARVPALGYAVAARPLSAGGAERHAASTAQPAQTLRGQMSAEPALQGSGFLLMASAPSRATIRLDYSFAQSCAAPVQLRLRALVARSPSSTLPFSVRTMDLGSRALTSRAGSESFDLPLTAANNGTWIFLADARCSEQGRVRFGVLTALPVLLVKIVDAPPPPPAEGSATIGAAGGFVNGPDGVRLGIPPAALESDITFRIARESSGAPPLPGGIDLASAVYAITPHGQAFAVSASVELPVSAALAAGRPTFLMKAEPGGRWSVIGSSDSTVATLRAGIDSLSYLAVGVCQDNLPAGSLFAQACPSSNQLRLELLLNGTSPVPISQDTTYGTPIPVVLVTTPETLTFRMTWTRPAGTNRVDTLGTGTGLSFSGIVRAPGFTFETEAPRNLEVNENTFSREFTVHVDPTRVSGATGQDGVVRRIWAQAAFAVTGPGNVGSADWEFNAWVPIRVRSLAQVPVIDSQPANVGVIEGQSASFSVAASVSPAATLSYQWARRAGASGSFTRIDGATSPSYAIRATELADDGAQFQVEVCALSRCVTSNVATLTVTQAAVLPSFSIQPGNQIILSGQTASFDVIATGVPLPQIRWQQAGSGNSTFTDIVGVQGCGTTSPTTGATNVPANCTIGPLTAADSDRRVRAVASNAAAPAGVPSSEATVIVGAAGTPPVITSQPAAQETTVGGSATFSVTATGTAPLNYTWRVNGVDVTTPSFVAGSCTGDVSISGFTVTLSKLAAACDGASIVVVVSNGINPAATSSGTTLTVNPLTTWTPQNASYIDPLVSVSAVNGSVAWVAGPGGDILRTENGGATWIRQVSGATRLDSISAVDAITAWAVGGEFIAKTTNRGQTWVQQGGSTPGWFLYSVSAVNSDVAWAVGFGGTILKTTDGGANWQEQVAATGSAESLFSVSAVDENTAWAVGTRRILKTTDGGASWSLQTPAPVAQQGVTQVVAATSTHAWVVTGAGVLRTTNGGLTWDQGLAPPGRVRLSAVRGNTSTVWALSSSGVGSSSAYLSTSGGVNWIVELLPGVGLLYDVSAVDSNTAWIVGDRGRILKR